MMTNGMRRLASAAAVAATVAAAGLMAAAPARADTIPASTTCSNPYTGSQAGPSSFDVETGVALSGAHRGNRYLASRVSPAAQLPQARTGSGKL